MPDWSSWEEFKDIKPGYFYHHDLEEVRANLFKRGIACKPSLTHKADIRKLTACLPNGRLIVTLSHELWPEAAAIAAHFGETYHGSGLPAVVGQALDNTIRMNREACSDQQRLDLWKAQDGKCKLCGEQLQDGQDECDHVVPLVESCRGQKV